jgi:hypothetical protein
MSTLLIVIILIVLLGGGWGYYGYGRGWYGPSPHGLVSLLVVILVIILIVYLIENMGLLRLR